MFFYFVFFFKQKTAYEMRISDWSSDVCSSDLLAEDAVIVHRDEPHVRPLGGTLIGVVARGDHAAAATLRRSPYCAAAERHVGDQPLQIGRASCRERVCQYV